MSKLFLAAFILISACLSGPARAQDAAAPFDGDLQRLAEILGTLHYLRGMTAKEIAALPCMELTIKGVESVLMRLKRVIQENTAYGQRE